MPRLFFLPVHCIRLQLNLSTVFEQGFERLHIIEKQAIFDHVLIVTCQCLQRIGGRYELKTTRDGSVVVDEFAARSFLGEERALVFGDCLCERFVCNRRIAKSCGIYRAGSRQASDVRNGHRHETPRVHRRRGSPWSSPRRCTRHALPVA